MARTNCEGGIQPIRFALEVEVLISRRAGTDQAGSQLGTFLDPALLLNAQVASTAQSTFSNLG